MLVAEDRCTGCLACVQICPKNAIEIIKNEEGFLNPFIHEDICVKCGKCEKICPVLVESEKKQFQEYYLLQTKVEEVLKASSSGGAFTELSTWVIEQGGSVYGAGFDKDFNVEHLRTTSLEGLSSMRGSKYVQSKIQQCYTLIENDLLEGKWVLFTGTPCQVAAVNSWLNTKKVNQEKYISCDLICHGVNSPQIWSDYFSHMSSKKSNISKVEFRNKDNGWVVPNMKIWYEDGRKYCKSWERDFFYRIFWSHNALRFSCYNCKFASWERQGDITLADALGYENQKGFDVNKGLSFVMINSTKGKELLQRINDRCLIAAAEIDKSAQPMLEKPVKEPEKREEFWKIYLQNGIDGLHKVYAKESIAFKIKYDIIKPFLRKTGLYSFANKIYLKIMK